MGGPSGLSGCSVAVLPSYFFFTTFLKNCGTGESLWITTCDKTVVWGLARACTL